MKVLDFFRWVLVLALISLSAFGLSVVSAPRALAGEVAALKGESAITFAPVSELAGQLVEIELVSSAKYPPRYEQLKQTVLENDWRPLMFATDRQPGPGKCTVTVLSDSYAVSCLMLYRDRSPDTLEIKVLTAKMAIWVANHFSRKLTE